MEKPVIHIVTKEELGMPVLQDGTTLGELMLYLKRRVTDRVQSVESQCLKAKRASGKVKRKQRSLQWRKRKMIEGSSGSTGAAP